MFDKLFGKKQSPADPSSKPVDSAAEALFRTIAEKRKNDPLIGVKIGADEINARAMGAFKSDKGVHIESVLTALGALAGYACQASVREEFIDTGKLAEDQAFTIVKTQDGKSYFFGDLLNKSLAESPYSVWAVVAGAAQQAGCETLFDLEEIFSHVAATVGTEAFGIPRVPDNHRASDTPENYVRAVWPQLSPVARQFCATPEEMPILFAMAAYKIILMGKDVLKPEIAAKIVMESAVAMSKINLRD